MIRTCVMNWLLLVVSCVTLASSRERARSRRGPRAVSDGQKFQLFLPRSSRDQYIVALDPRHADPRLDLGMLPRDERLLHPLRPENRAAGGREGGGERSREA